MSSKITYSLLGVLLYLTTIQFTNAQDADFSKSILKLTEDKPTSYSEIDALLKPFERDSLKMKSALNEFKTNNYREGSSYALNVLGVINRNLSNYNKSVKLHKQAYSFADKADNDEFRIVSLNMIGVAFRRMDMIKYALDNHTGALKIAYQFKNPTSTVSYNIAVSQNSIGNIYLALEQYDAALEQFKKSLAIEENADNQLGLAINYHNIGYAHEGKGNLDLALANYEKSLFYNEAIDSEIGRMICFNSIGGIYLKKEAFTKAEPIIRDALQKALAAKDQFYIVSSYNNLGQLEIALNQFEEAEKNLMKSLDLSKTYNLKSAEASSNKLLSEINQKKGNFKAALDYYQNAVDIESTILTEKNLQYVNDIVNLYENENKNNQIKALASENEEVRMRLERNKNIFWYSLLALLILGTTLYIINRDRALQRDKKILTLEQDMLRSQMNPHFIFNSLNSIKLYIINNEKENAVYYLNKFSKLIRKILIASKEKDTSLQEELDTMQLYMNIENIRFDNEIEFQINVDDAINTEVTKVPSLILQPFLENALWHGLSSKESNKKINLNVFKNSKDYITVEIIDNGIGRIASKKIRESKKLKRKSVGIDITKARLANFSKAFENSYTLIIDDLYEHDSPSGTRVTLNIPV